MGGHAVLVSQTDKTVGSYEKTASDFPGNTLHRWTPAVQHINKLPICGNNLTMLACSAWLKAMRRLYFDLKRFFSKSFSLRCNMKVADI